MEKITFLKVLKLKLNVALPLLGLFAVINGLWSSSLLMLVSNKIAGTPLPFFSDYDWLIYLVLVITSFVLTYYFKRYMIKVTLNFGKEMTLQIINKLRLSNYEAYLRIGEARVRTAMSDIGRLESLPEVFIVFFNALIMIIAGIGYMFWLYPKGAVMIIILIIVLAFIYVYRNEAIQKSMNKERDLDDSFMENYNDFLHGFNKIKMSTKRSDSIFFNHIVKNRESAIKLSIKAELSAFGNDLIGQYSFYIIIGAILFVLPLIFKLDQIVISGFMVALLFLMGPITIFINLMKNVIAYKIAFERVNQFNEIVAGNLKDSDSLQISISANSLPEFKDLYINNMSYYHVDDKESISFELKPINLKITRGEVIFISGGNGSGKSTFINLLSGLYLPKSGEIIYNDVIIDKENRSDYRDMISCIFSDDYLFSENYDDFNLLPSNDDLSKLLERMKLNGIIRQDVANNKIFQSLSSGQKKRLALIYSILEDKDIFIFDEWAAEQDPDFRKYFYESIIPELKSKGKTVIAITHDDAYYKFCDRLIKFNYGKMLDTETSFNPSVLVSENIK
ncbi:cyclic peptide export ABC transporter [Flavobacterium collinsii]|uniref:Cyclic peptide transporter. putative non ribosomal peptide export n=1 Tax=Flavobacterium collinsii TaxID=1114861 RepID=A0A9W4X6E8_9FLAO|nr:cyclic peptide export ABC transporter [Flavobacterium collinsii]CAI2767101.1 cyclic peptide transporter. putative non ribosomal peptide export [Flavobacterium collinsii]